MNKKKYKYVFIVLAFRTGRDIPGFIKTLSSKFDDYKVVVVNSYYNEESLAEIRDIAFENDCDFIPIENKGYGYGNNQGIKYALENYNFDYLIVCNADIEVQKWDVGELPSEKVSAPMITTINGKKQNPYWAKSNKFGDWLIYKGHKNQSRLFMFLGQGMNKLIREIYLLSFAKSRKRVSRIYAAHGSFLIFPRKIVDRIAPVFDENMFLYYEEAYLAKKLHRNNIEIELQKDISILHYEDGSTKGSNIDLSKHASQSYIYYYEKYCKK